MHDRTPLRATLLTAIAAGTALAAGCHNDEPARSAAVEVPPQPPPAAPPATSVPAADPAPSGGPIASATVPVPSAPASAPGPTPAPAPSASASPSAGAAASATKPPARPTTCESGRKKERYCFDAFKGPTSQLPNPKRSYDARGCLPDAEVIDTCNGVGSVLSGPAVEGAKCCYTVCRGPLPPCGRPLLAEDAAPRIAPAVRRADWSDAAVDVRPVRPEMARRLHAAWRADALAEHASVAAFSRFALELLAVGAPAVLVADAQHAALEEIGHARACFALAAAYARAASPADASPAATADVSPAATAEGPGPLSLAGVSLRTRLADVAAAAVEEACVGETFSAVAAAHARDGCTDPAIHAILDRIAHEEACHAELGWRFVAWALASGDSEVRAAVETTFARALAPGAGEDHLAPARDDEEATDWRAAGRLTEPDRAALWQQTRARLLVPCAEQLLAATGRARVLARA